MPKIIVNANITLDLSRNMVLTDEELDVLKMKLADADGCKERDEILSSLFGEEDEIEEVLKHSCGYGNIEECVVYAEEKNGDELFRQIEAE